MDMADRYYNRFNEPPAFWGEGIDRTIPHPLYLNYPSGLSRISAEIAPSPLSRVNAPVTQPSLTQMPQEGAIYRGTYQGNPAFTNIPERATAMGLTETMA